MEIASPESMHESIVDPRGNSLSHQLSTDPVRPFLMEPFSNTSFTLSGWKRENVTISFELGPLIVRLRRATPETLNDMRS